MFDERTIGRRELAVLLVVTGLILAVVLAAILWSGKTDRQGEAGVKRDPAEEAARAEIDQIYQEELAAAKAAALAEEAAREAVLNTTTELLNNSEDLPPTPAEDPTPEAISVPDLPVADSIPQEAATPAPDAVGDLGAAQTKDGQTVDLQAIIDSLRAKRAKR